EGADNSPAAAAIRSAAANITAIKGTATTTNRGIGRAAKFNFNQADPAMQQTLSQLETSIEGMSMPLPEEAVGLGARWEVRQRLNSNGIVMFQKAEYTVTAIDGNAVTLSVKTDQTAPAQDISNPAMPAGASMHLAKMSGTGTGTVALRLDGLVPTSN